MEIRRGRGHGWARGRGWKLNGSRRGQRLERGGKVKGGEVEVKGGRGMGGS